jgi:His/Glu/Gln/Arg/opine family amino acid ABC transporter permease subunit
MNVAVQLNILKLLLIKGLVPLLVLVPLALVLSLAIGILGGAVRFLCVPILDQILAGYIAVMRGLPILILLFIAYFVFPLGSNPFWAATVALFLYNGAYMIEIVRGGLQAVPVGQLEASRALGLSFWETVRLVILPQALLVVAPAIVGQLVLLIKETAVVSVIGYVEITRTGVDLMQTLFMPLPIFGYIAIYYFVICHLLKMLGTRLERAARQRTQRNVDLPAFAEAQ